MLFNEEYIFVKLKMIGLSELKLLTGLFVYGGTDRQSEDQRALASVVDKNFVKMLQT